MNEEEYKKAQKELEELEAIDWENDDQANDNAEYIDHRMNCLRADIFAYQHPEEGYNPYENLCN